MLLYNRHKQTVVWCVSSVSPRVNGNHDGMLIETCAGLLDNDEPEACIRKEAVEETGYEVGEVRKLFELFMSPGRHRGSAFLYRRVQRRAANHQRRRVDDEAIEVLELPLAGAADGR